MPRLLFEKKGNAVWISHLDLMRLFQRAFKRAGLPLVHTQGFNPRPSVSIALPLSVGVESNCELLDFALEGEMPSCDEIKKCLNEKLISGMTVQEVYEDCSKIKNLAFLDVEVSLEYDSGIPQNAENQIKELFNRNELLVEKRSKNGTQEQNIIPMIRSLALQTVDSNTLLLSAKICCQNPTLNPTAFFSAIERYLPEMRPDFSKCARVEVYDANETVFR